MKASTWAGGCVLLLLVLSLSACHVKRPDTVLPDAKMEDVLYDFHLARAVGEELSLNDNSQKMLYMDFVYNKHGVTQAQFDTSMVWFSRHPDELVKIYDKVNARLKSKRVEIDHLMALRGEKPKETQAGDSVEIWLDAPIYRLTGTPLDNKITFTFPADSNFQERDTLKWTARFRYPDTLSVPIMAMQVIYEKDTLHTLLLPARSATETLWLAADTLGELQEVRGFIYYSTREADRPLLVDRISLMRYHATDTLRLDTLHLAPADSTAVAEDTLQSVRRPDTAVVGRPMPAATTGRTTGNRPLRSRPASTRPLKTR